LLTFIIDLQSDLDFGDLNIPVFIANGHIVVKLIPSLALFARNSVSRASIRPTIANLDALKVYNFGLKNV
jgi:hypothetical protein